MSKESWIGKIIGGRYQIESLLGEGGMSAVYKAIDTRLDRPVAIKIIHSHLSESDQFLNRFKREGTAVAKLRHPNIIGVLDFGQEENSAYIVLAYVAGGSVQELLRQLKTNGGRMDSLTAVTLATEIADALEYAHQRGLTHRDVKPANMLLDKDGRAILTDFGLVKVAGGTRFTMTGAVMGTARYMSPEQIKSVTVDSRSDIYSLGVSLYEMASGSPPYEGDSAVTTMMKHLSEPVPDLCAANPKTPPQLAIIINRAMSKEPADRYQTAGEMAAALRQVREELLGVKTAVSKPAPRPITETMIVPPAGTSVQAAPIQPKVAQAAQPPQKSGGKKWVWLLLLLLLLIGGGSAAAFFFGGDGEGTETAVLPTNTPIPPTDTTEPTAAATAIPSATNTTEPTETATVTNTPTPASTPTPRSLNPTGAAQRGSGLPYDFEQFGTWVRGNQDKGSFRLAENPPANPELYEEDEPFSAAQLDYFFPGDEDDFVVFSQNNRINGSPDGLRLWVYGDGSGHFLNAWILDAKGETWQIPFGRVEHEGWQEMTAVIDTEQEWPFSHISGVDDGEVDYPISFRAFVFDDYEDSDSGEGTIYLDQLTAVDLSIPPTRQPSGVSSCASSGNGLPLSFESFGCWSVGDERNGTFTQSTDQKHSGSGSGKLHYNFGSTDNDYVVFMQRNAISGEPNALKIWVYGDGSGHYLNAWIIDNEGQTWQVPFGTVSHTGWREMTGRIQIGQNWPWTHISGTNNEQVDYPIALRAIVLDDLNNAYQGEGDIYLDDLTVVNLSTSSPQQPIATVAAISGGGLGRIVYVANGSLLTTDPAWSGGVELGSVASDSCSSPASTNTASYPLYFAPYCAIGGDYTRCTSPNGTHDVIVGINSGQFSIGVSPTDNPDQFNFTFQGNIKQTYGIRWSPLSDAFLFIAGDSVYRGFPTGGYTEILHIAYQPYYSADGSMILYRKPVGPGVNDLFVANADGSSPRNVTNMVSVDKSCAAWVR